MRSIYFALFGHYNTKQQQLQLNDFSSDEPTETCDKNIEYLDCLLPL